MAEFNHRVDINKALDDFDAENTNETENINPNNLVGSSSISEKMANEIIESELETFSSGTGVNRPVNAASLHFSNGIVSEQEAQDKEQAKRLAKETDLPTDLVEGELLDRSPEEIKALSRSQMIERLYPALNRWGANPNNYVLINRNVDWAQGVSKTFESLNPKKLSDVDKAISNSLLGYRRSLVDVGMALGRISIEDGKKLLTELDTLEAKNQYEESLPGLLKIQKESKEFGVPLEQFLRGFKGLYDSARDGNFQREFLKNIGNIGEGTALSVGELWDILTTMYDDPEAAKVFTIQALMSSAPAIGAGMLGGAVGTRAAGLKGGIVGSGMSAAAVSFPLEFSGKFREDLENFRDPNTGAIDYDEAFSDPKRVAQWRKEAAVFAGTIAASDAVYSLIIGKPFSKLTKAIPSKAGGAIAGIAAETATGAIEEGASNLTATIASQAVSPEGVSVESVAAEGENIAQDIVGGGIAGGTIGSALGALRYLLDTGKEKFSKLKSEVEKTNQATERAADLSNARAKMKEDKASSDYPEQTAELIEESMIPPIPETDPDIYDDADAVTAEEINAADAKESAGTVEFSPSKLTEYFINEEGLSVEEALSGLPESVYAEYARNRSSDTSVTVDISDWIRVTEEFPELDAFVRINGQELSADEAGKIQKEIEDDPTSLFQSRDDEESPPPLPTSPLPVQAQDESVQAAEANAIEAGGPSKVNFLTDFSSRFRVEGEEQAYTKLKNMLKKATKNVPNISDEALSLITEVQFRRSMNRAEVLGVPVDEIVEQLGTKRDAGRAQGVLQVIKGLEGGVLGLDFTADPSTLIHELGHLWLTDMSVDYFAMSQIPFDRMTDAQRAYWHSMKLVAKFFDIENVGQLNNLSDEKFVEVQERFAQTTEKYFLEGEFGNSTIRAIMESLRKFLVQIAEVVGTAYKQYPALQITPEVERMFEGIIAPKVKSDEVFLPLFPEPTFDLSRLGAEAEGYYDSIREALSEAVASFMSKVSKRKYRDRENLINEVLNSAYDEASAKINDLPEIILRTRIEESYADYKENKAANRSVSDPRFSYNSFIELMGEDEGEVLRKSLRNVVAAKKKGGIDAVAFMYLNDIHDPADMVGILRTMALKDTMIETEAEAIVKESLPVLKTDEEIEVEVNEALANEKTSRIYQKELKILADKFLPKLMRTAEIMGKSPETWISDKVTTFEAQKRLTETNLKGFRSNKFRADFRKQSKEAAVAFRRGDMTRAFEYKVRSIISYKIFLQSISAFKEVIKAQKRIKMFKRYSVLTDYAKQFDTDVMAFGNRIIEAFEQGISPSRVPMLFANLTNEGLSINIPDVSGVSVGDVARINQMIIDFEQQSNGRYGNNTSVGSMILFGELIKAIQSAARRAKKVEVGRNIMVTEEARTNLELEFAASTSMERSYDIHNRAVVPHFRANTDQLQTVVGSMYPSDEDFVSSTMGQLLSAVGVSESERGLMYDKYKSRIEKAIGKAINSSRDKTALERYLMPILRRVPYVNSRSSIMSKESKPIQAPELGITFDNISEYWVAELLMGSESGAHKLMIGGTEKSNGTIGAYDLDTGEIDRTRFNALRGRLIEEGVLTKEHFDMLQTIWDVFEELHPQVKKVLRETDGYNIGKVRGVPFSTPFGTYRGGYFPVAKIQELRLVNEWDSVINPDASNMSIYDLYPVQNTGMANQRNASVYPVDLNMNRTLMYLSSAVDIVTMRKPLLSFGKVLKGEGVRAIFEDKRPKAMRNVVIPWYEKVKNQQRSEPSAHIMDRVARLLRKNLNTSIYLGNYVTGIKQFTGLTSVAIKLGPKHLARGLYHFSRNKGQMSAFIEGMSPVMKRRFDGNLQRHIEDWEDLMVNFDWVKDASEGMDKMTYIFIQSAQTYVDKITWTSAYLKRKGELSNLQEKQASREAADFADFIVNSTQASSEVTWLNQWQTAKASQKLLTGIATSFVFSLNNVVTRETARSANQMQKARALLTFGFLYYFLNQAVDQAIMEAVDKGFGDEEDDEFDEEKLMNMSSQLVMGMLGLSMPIIGSIPEGMSYTGRVDLAPAFTKVSRDTTGAVRAAKDLKNDVPLTAYEVKSILKVLTYMGFKPAALFAKDLFVEDVLIESVFEETIKERSRDRRRALKRVERESRY